MNRSAILGVVFILLLLVGGCKDDPINNEPNVSIEEEFKILLWEKLSPTGSSFHLNIETIKSNSCENTTIDVAPSAAVSNISITIHDIPVPDCPAPIFPATAEVELGNMSEEVYEVQISLKNVVHNEGTMTVTPDFYEVKMKELNGIIVPQKRLNKIPTNTIWGYVTYSESSLDVVAEDFISEISAIATGRTYEDGYYGYFSVDNNKITILNNNITLNVNESFGFNYSGDYTQLINILSNYRSQNSGMEFKIYTSTGEEL